MKNYIFFLLIFSFTVQLAGQHLYEFEKEYSLNQYYEFQNWDNPNHTFVQKYSPKSKSVFSPRLTIDKYLTNRLINAVETGKTAAFPNKNLKIPLDSNAILKILYDTSMYYNSCEDRMVTLISKLGFRTDSIRYSVASTLHITPNQQLDCRVQAVAPLMKMLDKNGNALPDAMLFYFPVFPSEKKHAEILADTNITFAFQTKMAANFVRFSESHSKNVQQTDFRPFFKNVEKMESVRFESIEPAPISLEEVQKLVSVYQDSTVYWQPHTNGEQLSVVDIDPLEHLVGVRFVHDWYYDDAQSRLFAKMVAYAPIVAVKDEQGNLRYHKPLYYIIPR